MLHTNEISKLGMGGYRISHKSETHREALKLALQKGVNLIDTSTNYTDGQSEMLIGDVIKDFDRESLFIVSKAGYIQGSNLEHLKQLQEQGKFFKEVLEFDATLKHCIHPDFLQDQLEQSLKRLDTNYIDAFLIHNPEYYLKFPDSTQEEYYRRIKEAFIFLEEKVQEGKIRYYGISSNTFVVPTTDSQSTNLNKIIDLAKEVGENHHFKFIQFPFNLLETGALEFQHDGQTLLSIAQNNGLISLVNRPLNAFTDKGMVRLATYPDSEDSEALKNCDKIFSIVHQTLENKWKKQGAEEQLKSVPFYQQFTEIWDSLPTPDAVDQVFYGHFFPFVAQVWGENGVPVDEAQIFYDLYDCAKLKSHNQMSKKATSLQEEFIKQGLLEPDDERPFALQAIETYLKAGLDHILVGMRRPEYVRELESLF